MFSLTKQDTSVMKGIAICAMLCHHLYGCPPDGVVPYSGVIAWLAILGKICVALFLFCSGYGLAANYKPQTILDDIKFVAKRLLKFYANYWVIFLIFVPLTIIAYHRSLTDAYGADANICWSLFMDILGLQGWNSYNITWWFNRLIIILYLIFPLIFRVIRIQPIIALLLGIIIMRLEFHLPTSSIDLYTWQFPFMVGMVWKMYEDKVPRLSSWLTEHKILFAICSITIFVVALILRMFPIIPHWSNTRMDACVASAIVLLVVSIIRYMPLVSNILSFLGKHSMNIYLTHTFFNDYWHPEWLHAGEWLREGGNFVLLMTICVVISIGIEFLKEKIRLYELVNIITKRI